MKMEVPGKQKDTYDKQSKSIAGINTKLYCEPCGKDGLRLSAHGYCQDCEEHLCETCFKTHRKPAPCRHHVLLDKTQMPMSRSSGHTQAPHDLTEQCKLHKGKVIEYICHDHNTFGCSPCITTSHRNCKIDYIPDVSKDYTTSDEYIHRLRSLEDLQKQFQTLVEDTKNNKKKILENKSLVQIEIKKFRKEINDVLNNLETNLLKQSEEMFSKESQRMESLSSQAVMLEKEIEKLLDDINKLEKVNKINALYIHSKVNDGAVLKFTSAKEQASENKYVNKFDFRMNMKLKEILGSKSGMGEILGNSFETLTAKFCDEINVKIFSDEYDCCIPGAVLIAKDTVAIIDSTNFAVKIVDTKRKTVTLNKTFSTKPCCLALLPNDELAVTFTSDNKIVFLSISNDLSEVRSLVVDGKCKDIAYKSSKFIVSFEWPGKIQIMDTDGEVNKVVLKDGFGNKFDCPCISSDVKNKFYISDWKSSTVTSFNLKGEILKSYKDEHLTKPCAMAVLDDGSVLVCCSGNNSIFLISKNLGEGRVILREKDGLLCPYSLALDKEQNKFYVGSGKYCNFLKVYKLS